MATKVKYKPNHALVIRKGQDAAEAVGKRFGAYVMTTARRSLGKPRKDGKPSEPGQPPRATKIFKSSILFAYDPPSRSVVIGPRLLPGRVGKDAPEALEKGGTSTGVGLVRGRRVRRRQRVAARPTMVPALEARVSELPGLWKNAIHN